MARSRLVSCTVLLMAAVALAQPGGGGQPGAFGPSTPTPLVSTLLRYVSDPNFAIELGLTADQVKKLTDYRQKTWDEAYTTSPSEYSKSAEARAKATEEVFKGVLTPAQLQRAKQVAARYVFLNPTFGKAPSQVTTITAATLTTYPELAEIVKLSDEQKKSLIPQPVTDRTKKGPAPSLARVTLTADQIASLDKFMGSPPAQTFAATTDPRNARSRSFGATPPADLTLIRVQDVQTDLKLSEEQVKTVTALGTRWTARDRGPGAITISPEERDKQLEVLKLETDKFFGTTLTPEQRTRLRQIAIQRIQYTSTRDAFLRNTEVAKAIGLNQQQMKQLEAVAAEWETGMVKVFETDQNYETTNKAVGVVNAARNDRANAVLTPDQIAKLKEMVGAPYVGTFNTLPFGPGGFGPGGDRGAGGEAQPPGSGFQPPGGGPQPSRTSSAGSFGKYMLDLANMARNADVQADLKMTVEQLQKAATAYSPLTGRADSSTDNRSTITEKAVADILTADQQKRLRQIMIQIYDLPTSSSNLYMRYGAVAYPGVAEAIKLTPEQKTRILAGSRAADVLTADQQTAIKNMYGEPYKGRPLTAFPQDRTTTDRNPFRTTPAIPARVRLITGTTLDEPLKITPEQRKGITAAYADYQAARTKALDDFRAGSDAMNKAMTAIAEKFEKDAAAALNPEQRKRFEQLLVQSEAAESFPAVFRQQHVIQKLALTAEQSQKISAAFTDDEKIAALLIAQRLPIQKQSDLAAKIRDRCDAHILAVLTDQQKAAWKEMTGEPYSGFRKTPLGPRGFGGGGLGGGGFGGPPGDNR